MDTSPSKNNIVLLNGKSLSSLKGEIFKVTNKQDELKSKNECDIALDPLNKVIKQEVIDDQTEEFTKDTLFEPTNFVCTNIKKENLFESPTDQEVSSNGTESCDPHANTDISIPSRHHSELLVIKNSNQKSPIQSKPNPKVQLENRIQDIHEAAGPSRFNSDLLDEAFMNYSIKWFRAPVNVYDEKIGQTNCDSRNDLQDVVVKQEIVDVGTESVSNSHSVEQTNCSLADDRAEENRALRKRQGSMLDETQIKKEKNQDETDLNEKEPSYKDIMIKTEISDDVYFDRYEDNDVATPNCSMQTDDKNSVMIDSKNFEDVSDACMNSKMLLFEKVKLDLVHICALCDIYTERPLKEHIEEHHQTGLFLSCPYCITSPIGKISSLYAKEMGKHKTIIRMPCEYCGQKFRNSLELYIHFYEIHGDKVSTTCNICGYEAESYMYLIDHLIDSHNSETLIHRCQHCKFTTMRAAMLEIHMNIKHTLQSPIPSKKPVQPAKVRAPPRKLPKKCPICSFKTNRSLTVHMKRVHDDEVPCMFDY